MGPSRKQHAKQRWLGEFNEEAIYEVWAGIRTTCNDVKVSWEATASPRPEGKSGGSRFLEPVRALATEGS